MWSLRRAAHPIKNHGACRLFSAILNAASSEHRTVICNGPQLVSVCENYYVGNRNLCSRAGARCGGKDVYDVGFREHGTTASARMVGEGNAEEELLSESDVVDDNLLETDADAGGEGSEKLRASPELLFTLVSTPVGSVSAVLNKWVEDGKKLGRDEVAYTIVGLRIRRLHWQALEFSEWLEASKHLDLTEIDHATRLDLITKVKGLKMAEKYFEKIPESFRGEYVYRTLLIGCVFTGDRRKAEAVFEKMRKLKLAVGAPAYNQMLILYRRFAKNKIPGIISLMEKEKVKPSIRTYKILISSRGEDNGIVGMERIFQTMKAEGIEPDCSLLSIMARCYISAGLGDKAETILKEIEEGNLKEEGKVKTSIGARIELLRLYASLGKSVEVSRIWKGCEVNPTMNECNAAIEAWGMLGKVQEAEAVFDKMLLNWKKISSKHYSAMLNVYVRNKLVNEGMEFVKRIKDSVTWAGPPGSLTLDAIVRLYVQAGDLEKASSILQKVTQKFRFRTQKFPFRPLYSTCLFLMSEFAERGDMHNTEGLFLTMKKCGYWGHLKPFQVLFNAYINAKAPAYGFLDRMKAENVYPTKALGMKIKEAYPFRRKMIDDILD